MKRLNYLYFTVCGVVLSFVVTDSHATEVDTVVAVGYEQGGDRLLRVVFTDGTAHSVKANQGANVKVGALFYHTENLAWQTQATVGAQYNYLSAKNGAAEWVTYPVEVIGFYNANLIRIGAGASYQINPHLRTSGVVASYDADLNNAMGWIVQIGFRPRKKQGLSVDVRYTSIKYSGDATYAGVPQRLSNVDGSSVGVYLTAMF